MTFTKQPPTTPGFYAWRENENSPIQCVNLISDDRLESPSRIRLSRYKGFDSYGEWCRLVPAEEVEKAAKEILHISWGIGFGDMQFKECWQISRAKQIAEGTI